MIPAIALLTQRDVARTYPALQPALQALGNPSEQTLVIGGTLAQHLKQLPPLQKGD